MRRALRSQRAAYTLVEVLTVIGIIAILSAILLPVLGRVRENGRAALCSSNLQQIHRAFTQYVADNDSKLPVSTPFAQSLESRPVDIQSWPQQLQPYLKSTEVVVCPTERYYAGDDVTFGNWGSSYQQYWGLETSGGRFTSTEHEVKYPNPSITPMISDGAAGSMDNVAEVASPCAPFGTKQATILHRGGANFGFFDGHVKWLKPEQQAQTSCDLRKG